MKYTLVFMTAILGSSLSAVAQPNIVVSGNLVIIADGQAVPAADNGTDLGPARLNGNGNPSESDSLIRIVNDGTTSLSLSPAPSLSGPEAADFTVTLLNGLTDLEPGQSETLVVHFNPDAEGVRSAVVHITSNDPDTADYDFAVQGTGTNGQPNADAEFFGQVIKAPKVKCKTNDGVTTCKLVGKVLVFNSGGESTSPQTLRYHLSTDQYFDGADQFLGDLPALKAIAAGKSKKLKYKFSLPPTPSSQNLIININPDGSIPERFRHNNRVGTAIP
jgi:hypothetical protein